MKTATLQITFRSEDDPEQENEQDSENRLALSLSLATDQIVAYYGEEKSVFESGKPCFFKLSGLARNVSGDTIGTYQYQSTLGALSVLSDKMPDTVTEDLTFAYEREASLSQTPIGGFTGEWIGNSGGSFVVQGKTVRLAQPGVGILRCTYASYATILRLAGVTLPQGVEEIPVLVAAIAGERTAEQEVTYEQSADAESSETRDVELEVLDICTDDPVTGAKVYLDGELQDQTTDANGKITLSDLTVGQQYQLKVTATVDDGASGDYVSSDTDTLTNDWFIVEAQDDGEDDGGDE
ncbi:MAG: hypothetical protein SWH61_03245 [Thermodesulfobacteriota bacterium]|nr:hypothetical protein [Thermodesulfobacteriota bacterium]